MQIYSLLLCESLQQRLEVLYTIFFLINASGVLQLTGHINLCLAYFSGFCGFATIIVKYLTEAEGHFDLNFIFCQYSIYMNVYLHNCKLAWTKSRKSYCTTIGVGVGVGVSVSKMLKFLR